MTIATSALTDSLGASATPPNLGGESRYSIRKASVLCTLCSVLCMLMSCSEEQDLLVPEQTNALHITSVTIDGQQVARTRVVADGGTYPDGIPFNQSYNGFTEGDVLQLTLSNATSSTAYAIYNGTTWTLTDNLESTTSMSLKPDRENGKKWADVSMSANFFSDTYLEGEDLLNKAKELGAVQGKAIATENIHLLTDYLVATTSLTNQKTQGFGSITIDTDLKSPTLGAVTIQLKHTRALLRLPKSAANIEEGTYIVNGTAHNVTGLGTLWAEVQYGSSTYYYPLTEVGDYLQAIVVADLHDQMPGNATLTGFKAVMLTAESGIVGSDSFDETKTLTLDLPFKKGASTTVSTSIYLLPNYRYPLTLNIAPHTASVTLTSPLGKPGWGTDEVLSNEMNELLITVDGTQYIKLDGNATDVEKVKSIIETATAAGYTNFYVTGKTLAAYSNGTAKTVVGEAIRLLAEGTTVSLLLPDATSIAQSAFTVCKALASVSAPEATVIHIAAFGGCTSLASVEFPKVNTIMASSFGDCAALTSVEFPLVNQIGNQAFGGCATLTSLTFGEVITSVDNNAFLNVPTGTCALTLNSGQQNSTVPVGTDDNGKPTWAGRTWASISYVDNEGNAVESN